MSKRVKEMPKGVHCYYVRDEQNHPVAAVVVGESNGKVFRGVSICSKEDRFDRVKARKLAYSRYSRAVGTGQSDMVIVSEYKENNGLVVAEGILTKIGANVIPTVREEGILE